MRVALVSESCEFEELVRYVVGSGADIVPFVGIGRSGGARPDLVVAEASRVTPKLLRLLRNSWADVPFIQLLPSSAVAGRLRVHLTPADLGSATLRQVVERFGRTIVADYLIALLRLHRGNVTRAAVAAGLERESLHRLLRRHQIRADRFRPAESK